MNETVIVVTGASPLRPDDVARLPRERIVLAADGGLDHALAAGLVPAGLIGDLDSVSNDGLAWAEQHATISRHPSDKDRTDTELALAMAVDLHPERIVLLAGGGDRFDHTLAAIGALGDPTLTGVPSLEAWWGGHRFVVLHGPGRCTIDTEAGTTLSLLATHGWCTGVKIAGTKWPLDGVELAPLSGRGISNEADADQLDVAVSSGVLTIVIPPAEESS